MRWEDVKHLTALGDPPKLSFMIKSTPGSSLFAREETSSFYSQTYEQIMIVSVYLIHIQQAPKGISIYSALVVFPEIFQGHFKSFQITVYL